MSGETTRGPARSQRGAEPEPGDLIGGYIVLGVLGRGGGGLVLSAHDPSLDRRAALKLVRPGDGSSDPGRLLDEAQALARLSHPNVVPVYEVGAFGDHVFIAMEQVDGADLARWCDEQRPGRSAIIAAYVEAGRGLAAAHAAGITHGDFKPRNAVMGTDGRVRLIDFGLARTAADASQDSAPAGTPAYMAPEQLQGAAATPASDQYSFCMALHHALTGRLVGEGEQPGPGLPRWLARLLRRGLAARPEDRHPSMKELVDALAEDRAGRQRRRLGMVGAVALAGSITWWAASGSETQPLCPGSEPLVSGVWSPARRAELERSLAARGVDPARAIAAIDDYFTGWVALRDRGCRKARIERTESDTLLELRNGCLDDRLRDARVALDVIADPRVPGYRAAQAAMSLPNIGQCDNRDWLLARVKPPDDANVAAETERIRTLLARSVELFLAGLYDEAEQVCREADRAARAIDYLPVRAETASRLGHVLAWTGDADGSEALLREAVRLALRSRHYETATRAWDGLLWLLGATRGDRDAAYEVASLAESMLDGLEGVELSRASVIGRRGVLRSRDGKHAEALADLRECLALRVEILGEHHPDVGYAHHYLAEALLAAGRPEEALVHARAAQALFRDRISRLHPQAVEAALLIARSHRAAGRPAEAVAELTAVLPDLGAAFGRDPFGRADLVRAELAAARADLARPESSAAPPSSSTP